MFTSSVFKKDSSSNNSNVSFDSIVDDVIADFTPDESDREMRRRRGANSSGLGVGSLRSSPQVCSGGLGVKNEKHVVGSVENRVNGDNGGVNGESCNGYVERGEKIVSERKSFDVGEEGASLSDMVKVEETKEKSETTECEKKEYVMDKVQVKNGELDVKEVEMKVFSLNAEN